MLHGAIGASEQFNDFVELLNKHFILYHFDFSGHGKSEAQPVTFTIDLFAQDVLNFIDANGLDRPNVFGYSMGGFVALNLAAQYPNKLTKIITLATKFKWDPSIAEEERKLLNPAKIKEKVPAFAVQLQKLHGQKWEQVLHQTANMMQQLGQNNPLQKEQLSTIKNEVLLLLGDSDKMVSLSETQAVKDFIPTAHLQVLQNTVHPWEQVNQLLVSEKIKEFLDAPNN